MRKRYVAAYLGIALIALAFLMAYLVRPHAPNLELVTEAQELPDPNAHYSQESGLPQRVSRSHGLALVLVISEFSRNDAVALEALRSWAHANFQRDPGFLHSVNKKNAAADHDSIVDSLCYSLFTLPRMLLEGQALHLLKHQIGNYHHTKAFQSFRANYFDSFGLDHESANMLARYQSERAAPAVGVILAIFYWIAAVILGIALHFRSHPAVRSTRWQRSLAFFWFALSLFYIIVSWVTNDVSILVSSIVCALTGLYLRRPIAISFGEDKGLSMRLLVPDRAVLATATWVTISLVAIQVLTWMRTGSLEDADPITLILSAITGDFLHDHANAKKLISRIIGVLWLLVSGLTVWAATHEGPENLEKELAPISDSLQ